MAAAAAAATSAIPTQVQEFMQTIYGEGCTIETNTVNDYRKLTTKFRSGQVELWLAPTSFRQVKLVVDGKADTDTLMKIRKAKTALFTAAANGEIRGHEWRPGEIFPDNWKAQTIWAGFAGNYNPAHLVYILPEGLEVGINGNVLLDRDTKGLNAATGEKPDRSISRPITWFWKIVDGTLISQIRIPTHDGDVQMGTMGCVIDPGAAWKPGGPVGIEQTKVLVVVREGGAIAFPGGRVEKDDKSAAEAVKREILEETGIEVPKDANELMTGNSDWLQNEFVPGRNETFGFTVPGASSQPLKVQADELDAAIWVPAQDILDGKELEYTKADGQMQKKPFAAGMKETLLATLERRGLKVIEQRPGYKATRSA